jgi:hypothetical protein
MKNSRWFAALLSFQMALSPALAQSKKDKDKQDAAKKAEDQKLTEIKKYFEDASIQYKTGEYAAALENFKKVYAMTQEPSVLFNIGQCQRFLGQSEEAIKTFRTFIREAPDSPQAENAKARIAEIEAEIAKKAALGSIQVFTNPEGAMISIDGKEVGPGPIDVKDVQSGEHTIAVKKGGFYNYEFRFELQPGQAFSIRVPLREEVKVTPKPDPLQPKYFFMVAGGTGVISGAIGGAALFLATQQDDAQTNFSGVNSDRMSTAGALALGSDILVGVALVAITSGIVLRLSEKKKSAEPCQVQ